MLSVFTVSYVFEAVILNPLESSSIVIGGQLTSTDVLC